jgi:hypothetical protein
MTLHRLLLAALGGARVLRFSFSLWVGGAASWCFLSPFPYCCVCDAIGGCVAAGLLLRVVTRRQGLVELCALFRVKVIVQQAQNFINLDNLVVATLTPRTPNFKYRRHCHSGCRHPSPPAPHCQRASGKS